MQFKNNKLFKTRNYIRANTLICLAELGDR